MTLEATVWESMTSSISGKAVEREEKRYKKEKPKTP